MKDLINMKKFVKTTGVIMLLVLGIFVSCENSNKTNQQNSVYDYTNLSRLTDPQENAFMLDELPNDITEICDISNKQIVHYRLLSQYEIHRKDWNNSSANHDIKDILDTLKIKGDGKLDLKRNLEDRVLSSCTKESIFLTALLRNKRIPARIRVGYLTNLYKGNKSIEFWQNVNLYERAEPVDTSIYNGWTRHNAEINRSIEHYVTEYWDEKSKQWKVIDAMPGFLESHGVYLQTKYHLIGGENFEYAWQVWQKRDSIEEDAYAERGWSAKTHVKYQMLMDFYCLLNHEGTAIFEDNGIQTDPNDERRKFIEKDYDSLRNIEIMELDKLAELIGNSPSVNELVNFYKSSNTLKMEEIEKDNYSFIYLDKNNKASR